MNQSSKMLFALSFAFLVSMAAQAQDDLLDLLDSASTETKSRQVFATFKTTRIVNGHSIETVKRKSLDFRVTHHFGDVSGESGGVHTLYGLDQAADIRIAFEWGVNDRLTLGAGRSKISELLDGYAKYRLWRQTEDNKMPVSTTLLINAGFSPQKNLSGEYSNAAHRLSYTYQLLIARKFNSSFSLQLMPTVLHRNYLFNPNDQHDLVSLGIGGRLKLSKRFALLADYFHTFSSFRQQNSTLYSAPLGLGVEIETGGHVFHMFFTNNAGIVENAFIPNTTSSWTKGEFKFGFNISRTFALGR
jgi:hypothetical protein